MKKFLILLLLLSTAFATTNILSQSYPTNRVKHGDMVTYSFEYESDVSNSSKLIFNGEEYSNYACGDTTCLISKQISIPNTLIGDNISWQFIVGSETLIDGKLPVMDLNLSYSYGFTSIRDFNVRGNFTWEDGTPLQFKTVMVSFIEDKLLTTGSNGAFEKTFTFEDTDESREYIGNVTALFGSFSKRGDFYGSYHGVPEPTLSFDKNSLHPNDVSYSEDDVVELEVTWNTPINPVNKTRIYFSIFDHEYSEECVDVVSNCEKNFDIVIPSRFNGTHNLIVFGYSQNADSTETVVNKTISVIITDNDWYSISPTSLTKEVYAGESHQFELDAARHGNVFSNITISIAGAKSEWVNVDSSKFSISGSQKIPFGINVPYEAEKGSYNLIINILGKDREFQIPLTITVKAPNLIWDPVESDLKVATEEEINFTSTISNDGQADALDVRFEPICPLDWVCTLSGGEDVNLGVGESKEVKLTATIKHVESVIDPHIGIKATDQVGRSAEAILNLDIVSEVVELSQDKFFHANIVGEDYVDRYFFISGEEYFNKPELNYNGTRARIQRTSPLSTWSVKVLPDSRGVGSICEVFVVAGNNSYELDPLGVERTLVGEVGDYAWEAIEFKEEGECYAHLQYNNEDTISYLVMSRPPAGKQSDIDKISALITATDEKNDERNKVIVISVIAGLVFILSKRKIEEKQLPAIQKNMRSNAFWDTSVFDKKEKPKYIPPKIRTPTQKVFDRVKGNWDKAMNKLAVADEKSIDKLESDVAGFVAEKSLGYVPKHKRKRFATEGEALDDLLGPKGGR